MTNEEKNVKILKENNGIITTKELTDNGIDRVYLTRLMNKKIIDNGLSCKEFLYNSNH